jgi:DNA-binding transcriptional regulator LsrR (DeoR family)
MDDREKSSDALKVARMYFYQNMTTETIARELNVSRSTVSRLLTFAREQGLINIQIVDPNEHPQLLEKKIVEHFGIKRAHVVPVPGVAGEGEWLSRVVQYAANYLNTLFDSDMVMGIAWGTTISGISKHLLPKATHNSQIIQLNGAGNTQSMGIEYASEIIVRFAQNYQAVANLFPVPTFFDYAATKQALWKERSIQRLLDLQNQADLLLYSIGSVNAGVPSHVYSAGYMERADLNELKRLDLVGDIATVFFRGDGSFNSIPLNERTSGPGLELFQRKHGICVVSGFAKVRGLAAALKGRLITELIIDEPTARNLVEGYILSAGGVG